MALAKGLNISLWHNAINMIMVEIHQNLDLYKHEGSRRRCSWSCNIVIRRWHANHYQKNNKMYFIHFQSVKQYKIAPTIINTDNIATQNALHRWQAINCIGPQVCAIHSSPSWHVSPDYNSFENKCIFCAEINRRVCEKDITQKNWKGSQHRSWMCEYCYQIKSCLK